MKVNELIKKLRALEEKMEKDSLMRRYEILKLVGELEEFKEQKELDKLAKLIEADLD